MREEIANAMLTWPSETIDDTGFLEKFHIDISFLCAFMRLLPRPFRAGSCWDVDFDYHTNAVIENLDLLHFRKINKL